MEAEKRRRWQPPTARGRLSRTNAALMPGGDWYVAEMYAARVVWTLGRAARDAGSEPKIPAQAGYLDGRGLPWPPRTYAEDAALSVAQKLAAQHPLTLQPARTRRKRVGHCIPIVQAQIP